MTYYMSVVDDAVDDGSIPVSHVAKRLVHGIRDEVNSNASASPFDSINLRDASLRIEAAMHPVYVSARQRWHETAKVTFGGYSQGISVVVHIAADHPANATETKMAVTLIASTKRIQ